MGEYTIYCVWGSSKLFRLVDWNCLSSWSEGLHGHVWVADRIARCEVC